MGASDHFAELDALRAERNSAVAEAKLWLRRMLLMQKERDKAKAELNAVIACLQEWQTAYDDLLKQFRRLEVSLEHEKWSVETADFLHGHLYPLAMAQLQHLTETAPE